MSKLDFVNVAGLEAWFANFAAGKQLTGVDVNSLCFGYVAPDYGQYVTKMINATSDKERNAIFGQAVVAATRFIAPLKDCAWVSCKGMIERSGTWFTDSETTGDSFKSWHNCYNALKGRVPSLAEVQAYKECVMDWREFTGFDELPSVRAVRGEMRLQYAISADIAMTVKDMLEDMKEKRDAAFGPGSGRRGRVSQDHVGWMRMWLNGGVDVLSAPGWGSWDKVNSYGKRLAATAIVNLYDGTNYDSILIAKDRLAEAEHRSRLMAAELDPVKLANTLATVKDAIDEAEVMITQQGNGGGAVFQQQMAAMDVPFSSHYWLWRCGGNYNNFPVISQFLFELGQRPVGAAKIAKMLGDMPWIWARGLRGMFADSNFNDKIHIHPAVLTQGRLSDMASCFGAIPANNPDRAREGTGNSRFILNLRRSGRNLCGTVAAKLFEVYRAGFDIKQTEIIPPEHMLHQSFLGKNSHMQYAGLLEGDFTKIEIVEAN
ncbi:nucleoprotein [Gossas virus]|uniref:Nucleoprotein n=1 Tax=Gossas virus TaxID=1714376 RepID=A0A0M4KE49_9VIRU|nr:nucleoprotein [Gossas virus]ALD83624.1 nucleoprotein [Gossas virus]